MTFGKTLRKKRFWNKSLSVNLFLLIFGFVKFGYSQSYSRPSITPIFLNYKTGPNYSNSANSIVLLEKFDSNFFGQNYINLDIEMETPSQVALNNLRGELIAASEAKNENLKKSIEAKIKELEPIVANETATRNNKVLSALKDNRIASKILSSLLIDDSKSMSLDKLSKRAEYNASDSEVMVANNSEAKMSAIRDNGLNLLNNIHIILVDTKSITQRETKESGPVVTYTGSAYLYKINIDTLFKTGEFDNLVFTEPNTKKFNDFQNFQFPIDLMMEKGFSVNLPLNGNVFAPDASSIFSGISEYFSANYEPFIVKASVFEVSPISSKIGTKESLKIDHLYRVSQTVQNRRGEINDKTVGWVRVKKVADNKKVADGKTEPSLFYKTFSKDVDPGMKLTHKPEVGLTHGFGYNVGENNVMVGPYYNAEFNSFTVRGARLGLTIGGLNEVESIGLTDGLGFDIDSDVDNFRGRNLYGELSFLKIFQANIIEFTPMAGVYASAIKLTDASLNGNWESLPEPIDEEESSLFYNSNVSYGATVGFKFGINFGKYTQFYLGYKAGFEFDSELELLGAPIEDTRLRLEIPRVAFVGFRLIGF
jgi:hypothetical protein